MRILFTATACEPMGGVETILRQLTPALMARGHQVALVCERRVDPNPAPGAIPGAESWFLDQIGPAVWTRAQAWKPDVVGVNPMQSAANETRAAALAPAVYFAHNLDSVCLAGTRLRWRPTPHVCQRVAGSGCLVHSLGGGCGPRDPLKTLAAWRTQQQRQRRLARYSRVLAFSRYAAGELRRAGAPEAMLRWLHYVPPHRPAPTLSAREALPHRVLCLSRLVKSKGVETLLSALRLAEDRLGRRLQLTHAGAGPIAARAQRLGRQLGLEVRWLGWVNDTRVRELLNEADLLAVPSLLPEPFGIVGREAQTLGLPAVAFAHGGITEWLEDGVNGHLAAPGSLTSDALAAAITAALATSEHLESLRRGAWASARNFEHDEFVTGIETVLREAVSDRLQVAVGEPAWAASGA